jgi:hypothetical protein
MVLVFSPSKGDAGPGLAAREELPLSPASLESSTLQRSNPLAKAWQGKDGTLISAAELPLDKSVFHLGDFYPSADYSFRIPGIMTDSEIPAVGKIIDLASSPTLGIAGEISYGEFSTRPKEGERFLLLREMPEPKDPNGEASGLPLYAYTATVGVVKINHSGIASLLVEAGPFGAMEGDLIVPFRNLLVSVNPKDINRTINIRTKVVGVLDDDATLAGEAQAVFLEKTAGVNVGDDVSLYMPPAGTVYFNEDEDTLDAIPVAVARIVEIGDKVATAVILKQTREVSVGARTYARP